MLSVVIPTRDCEHALVATLASLVPGLMASAVREVIVADGGSTDQTPQVVDVAGCTLFASDLPLGARLAAAAATARADWLMFLHPGAVLEQGWAHEVLAFGEAVRLEDVSCQAAVFRSPPQSLRPRSMLVELAAVARATLAAPNAKQGLVVSTALYRHIGGHRDERDPENALIRRIGRRRIARLRTALRPAQPERDQLT
jgi:hypothetical protein